MTVADSVALSLLEKDGVAVSAGVIVAVAVSERLLEVVMDKVAVPVGVSGGLMVADPLKLRDCVKVGVGVSAGVIVTERVLDAEGLSDVDKL